MIRFLQQDNKFVKILFGVIIGAACISMVIYLVPGLRDSSDGSDGPNVFATVRAPGLTERPLWREHADQDRRGDADRAADAGAAALSGRIVALRDAAGDAARGADPGAADDPEAGGRPDAPECVR